MIFPKFLRFVLIDSDSVPNIDLYLFIVKFWQGSSNSWLCHEQEKKLLSLQFASNHHSKNFI